MVLTRSQSLPGVESWTLIGTLKEVRIPARPRSSSNPHHMVTQSSHIGYTTQGPTPPETFNRASSSLTASNEPSQLSALTKVFDTVHVVLHHYAPECLPVLYDLQSMIYNFITNYREERWPPNRPHVKFDRDVVRCVLDEVHRIAHVMMNWDRDVEIFEHAVAWAIIMFENGASNVQGWEEEGVSEVHLGMWEFVRWLEQEY
jgi:hypothetical protein